MFWEWDLCGSTIADPLISISIIHGIGMGYRYLSVLRVFITELTSQIYLEITTLD